MNEPNSPAQTLNPASRSANNLVLQAIGLKKSFAEGDLLVHVLQDVNLSLQPTEVVAIVGSSGSGKSTLLHVLGGLESVSSGSISVCGRSWAGMSLAEQGAWRNQNLGFIYQFHHLLAEFSALENVAMPLRIRGEARANELAAQALAEVGLAHRLRHLPGQLSGGERQRCAVARALVTHPKLVLADEPTGNLDGDNAAQVFELILQRAKQTGCAVLLVTHDRKLAQACDRSLELVKGALQPPR